MLASLATITGLCFAAWQFHVAMEKDAEARQVELELVIQSIDAELIRRVGSIDRLRSEIAVLGGNEVERRLMAVGLSHEIRALDAYTVSIESLSRELEHLSPRLSYLIVRVCEYLSERDFLAGEYTNETLYRSQDVCALK